MIDPAPTYDVVDNAIIIEPEDDTSWLTPDPFATLAQAVVSTWSGPYARCFVECRRCGIAAGFNGVDPMLSWTGTQAKLWADAHNEDVH